MKDNLVYHVDDKIQKTTFHNTRAIIDEADFILIDEARTPLIISGESPLAQEETYYEIRQAAATLKKMSKPPTESILVLEEIPKGDFWVDDKNKTVHLSEAGYDTLEKVVIDYNLISDDSKNPLYQPNNAWILHEILNALKAEHVYIKDKDYLIKDGEIIIIDPNTGRLSPGRTWSGGLHQAIECKENLNINPETMTLGSISIQNYFKIYNKISGMSGTIMQSTTEFEQIYGTTTVQIPTNKKTIRKDHQDKVYLTLKTKYKFLIEDISERHQRGQPILVGTTSVAESETISKMLHEKIDVTAFYVWFIENYPQSAKIMKENPDYQLRFL